MIKGLTQKRFCKLVEVELRAALKQVPRTKGVEISSIIVRLESRKPGACWSIEQTLNVDAGKAADLIKTASPV